MPTARKSYDRATWSGLHGTSATSTCVEGRVKHRKKYPSGLSRDAKSLVLLLLLYTLQGVPMGLSASISFLLQEKGASLSDIGYFSFSSWPFSLKVIWAPIVDSLYFRSVGRRRSWVLPLQVLVGLTFIMTSSKIDELISDEGSDVKSLTTIFFWIYVLLASQDIAVDGWALTLLSRQNIGLASTCNSIGQTAGFFLSFTGFLILNSRGIIGLDSFMFLWGVVFLSSSISVLLMSEHHSMHPVKSVKQAYEHAFDILRLPVVRTLASITLTRALAFSAAETLTQLKLLDRGIPKQHLAIISACMTPVSLAMPLVSARWTGGSRPLDCVMRTYMSRAIIALGASVAVILVPTDIGQNIYRTPWAYYVYLLFWHIMCTALSTVHFVSFMAFFSRISDTSIGGTYMTLLNSVSNLGYKLAETGIFFLMGATSSKRCIESNGRSAHDIHSPASSCADAGMRELCTSRGGTCVDDETAFHFIVILSPLLSYVWLACARQRVVELQGEKLSKWCVN